MNTEAAESGTRVGHRPRPLRCAHRTYLMSCDEFDRLREHAEGRCQICRIAECETSQGILFIDHDPFVGQWAVRGLLCNRCNSTIHLRAHDPHVLAYLANPWHVGRLTAPSVSPAAEEALANVDHATSAYRAALADIAEADVDLKALVIACLQAGIGAVEVAEHSPFTAAHVRKLAREAGIPPAKPGIKPRKKTSGQ